MIEKKERMGESIVNNFGSLMTIVEYRTAKKILVKFEDDTKVLCSYSNFKNGKVNNPFDKTKNGVGYIGVGRFKPSHNGVKSIFYEKWHHMLQRCYEEYKGIGNKTYEECYVCEEWLNYQNFAEWMEANYYIIKNEKMCLDKDILIKGNKLYSPETCCFVPNRINVLFTKRNKLRGDFPIGVSFDKRAKKFSAVCNNLNKSVWIGYYNTPEEAFIAYKNFKEHLIISIAEAYKEYLPYNIYEALLKYKIEIGD